MKNKKTIVLMGALGLLVCLCLKTNAIKFYDTIGTRYEGAVERLGELGIINGVSDKAFEANRTITRAEFAKMIVEATLTQDEMNALIIDDANCTFTDISKDKWYYQYVVAATNYGYINGYEDNTFRPDDEVTYEQVAKMLMKALGHAYLVETDPRGWSAEYMDKMYSLNIADGTAKFAKTDRATRGNVAIMLWNTLTSNVWEKILLNDVDGFTYIDSGRSLFNKKIEGYVFQKKFRIDGFKEIDDKLYLKIDKFYYKLYDQDASVLFSMLGGKAEGLFKYMRYPNDEYRYEIVGLSTDLGSQLYSGTLNELKNEGFTLKIPTTKIGTDVDYAYLLKAEEEENDRAITLNADAKRFYIQKIEIKTEKGEAEKDDKETIEKIEADNHAYEYIAEYVPITKTIKLNDEYEIKDGAVLFENNKRVKWDTVKEGDVITEIKKDEYYFLSHKEVEATINECVMKSDEIKFTTSKGEITAYYKADCLEYYAKNGKTKYLYTLKDEGLRALVGLKVRFLLDFTGKAVRVEVLEETEEEKLSASMQEMNLAYYKTFNATEEDKNNMITLIVNGKEKTYRSTLKGVNAEYGDLVYFEVDSRNIITAVKPATNGTKIDEKLKMSKMDYDDLMKLVENKEVTTKVPLYLATYHYDFGEYDKITDFEVKKTDVSILSDLNEEKLELYVVADDRENIKLIIVMNYSEKKDVFYGKIERIYTENANIKAEISIFGYKKMTYTVSGLLNCEENDMVSFKILGKDAIKILEKYNVAAMGYYKDIIIKEVVGSRITAENAEIDLKQGKIMTEEEEYLFSHFDIILLILKKDTEGNLYIYKGYGIEPKGIKLEKNDRIAINEIEDTIIIYRGY